MLENINQNQRTNHYKHENPAQNWQGFSCCCFIDHLYRQALSVRITLVISIIAIATNILNLELQNVVNGLPGKMYRLL